MKNIKFIAKNQYGWEVCDKPFPASEAIPDWWKALPAYTPSEENPNGTKMIIESGHSNAGAKKCIPMLDAITSGYIIPLWADVQARQENGSTKLSWRVSNDVFQVHGVYSSMVDTPLGYDPQVLKFINTWRIVTPPGYSVLITQPFGYRNTPFQAIPAIIDTDTSTTEILPPMWIREGFEGIIEKGTPLVQITPFKRDNWESEFSYMNENEYRYLEDRNFNSYLKNHYVRKVWQKKKYK